MAIGDSTTTRGSEATEPSLCAGGGAGAGGALQFPGGGPAVRCGFDSRSRPRVGAGRARLSTRAVGLRVDFSNDAVGVETRVASALIFSSPDSGKCHALLGKSPACLAAMPGRDSRDERSG